jgi:hypothetical protein
MLSQIQTPLLALILFSPLCALGAECDTNAFEALAAKSPYGVTVTDAKQIDEIGGNCQIEGEIANAENGQSQIKFRLRFLEAAAWNGKFLMIGNGGTAGVFQGEQRGISRPWCPYPQVARLREPNLDSNNALSFHCINPPEWFLCTTLGVSLAA